MPEINFFEIPANDVERARKFYTELFGQSIEKAPEIIGFDYWLVNTDTDKTKNHVQLVKGGMIKRKDPKEHPITYVDVPSIDEYSLKIEELGGKILFPKTAAKGMGGSFAYCEDTENNRFGLWENDPNIQKNTRTRLNN